MGSVLSSLLGTSGFTQVISDLGATVEKAIERFIPDPTVALQLKAERQKATEESHRALYESMAQVMAADPDALRIQS